MKVANGKVHTKPGHVKELKWIRHSLTSVEKKVRGGWGAKILIKIE